MTQSELLATYDANVGELALLSRALVDEIAEILDPVRESLNIDQITGRVKSRTSFLAKSNRLEDGNLVYPDPFKDIQDVLGARIVVYYKQNLQEVARVLSDYLHHIELQEKKPKSLTEFDYEGLHLVAHIPANVSGAFCVSTELLAGLFELQVKTLFQHSWSQSEHKLGYKPTQEIDSIAKRQLAFVAAQSWGADEILAQLYDRDKLREGPKQRDVR